MRTRARGGTIRAEQSRAEQSRAEQSIARAIVIVVNVDGGGIIIEAVRYTYPILLREYYFGERE